jgi:hypothetical protein
LGLPLVFFSFTSSDDVTNVLDSLIIFSDTGYTIGRSIIFSSTFDKSTFLISYGYSLGSILSTVIYESTD